MCFRLEFRGAEIFAMRGNACKKVRRIIANNSLILKKRKTVQLTSNALALGAETCGPIGFQYIFTKDAT